jgi:hypothetical protein
VTLSWAAVLQLGAFFLPVVPLLLLLVSLLFGRYPGHRAIVRLSERFATRGRNRGRSVSRRAPRPPCRFAAAGGLLIALSLAQRPPPLAA